MIYLILLDKLEHYGIRGSIPLLWFKNYLSNRKQYVEYNGIDSNDTHNIWDSTGVCSYGPLLFYIYINDITASSKVFSFTLFANAIKHNN